jgi:hypothetical protein
MTMAASAQPATFGNPDEPPQGALNAKNPASVTDLAERRKYSAGRTHLAAMTGASMWVGSETNKRRLRKGANSALASMP